jgi:hypothetical protein
VSDYLTLTDADDGKLFRVRVLNTGEERIARDHRFTLAGRELKFPCLADPDKPKDKRVGFTTLRGTKGSASKMRSSRFEQQQPQRRAITR